MDGPGDDRQKTTANVLSLIIAAVLVCFSLIVLLRLEHFIVRRDCYMQGMNACPSIGAGRYPHF